MFLNESNFKSYNLHKYKVTVTNEGAKITYFSEDFEVIRAEIYPASGKVQSSIYGERLNYILNAIVRIGVPISEKDGICVNSDTVNYRVISIKEYTYHKILELELIR